MIQVLIWKYGIMEGCLMMIAGVSIIKVFLLLFLVTSPFADSIFSLRFGQSSTGSNTAQKELFCSVFQVQQLIVILEITSHFCTRQFTPPRNRYWNKAKTRQ
jgi:hypothetical protein